MKSLLSIQEAADLLGVHPETLRRWDKEGKLQAVKIGERGDRKYRQEDLMKIISGFGPEKYKDYSINPYSSGFQRLPDRLIRVASFVVTKNDLMSVFAFTDGGLLLHMSYPNLKDDDLIEKAKEIIRGYIDNNNVKNLEEYTFEFFPANFLPVKDPIWWTKTLKKIYG